MAAPVGVVASLARMRSREATVNAAWVAVQIVGWVQAALRQAQWEPGWLRVRLAPRTRELDVFTVEPRDGWLYVSIGQPNLSVFAYIPLAAPPEKGN